MSSDPLVYGGLSADAIERYTTGGCFFLALKLHQRCGWPLTECCFHGAVQLAPGVLLDVMGIWNQEDAESYWNNHFHICERVSDWLYIAPRSMVFDADKVVDKLLEIAAAYLETNYPLQPIPIQLLAYAALGR